MRTKEDILKNIYDVTDEETANRLKAVLRQTEQTAEELLLLCMVCKDIPEGTIDAYILGVLDGMGYYKEQQKTDYSRIAEHEEQERQRMKERIDIV